MSWDIMGGVMHNSQIVMGRLQRIDGCTAVTLQRSDETAESYGNTGGSLHRKVCFRSMGGYNVVPPIRRLHTTRK